MKSISYRKVNIYTINKLINILVYYIIYYLYKQKKAIFHKVHYSKLKKFLNIVMGNSLYNEDYHKKQLKDFDAWIEENPELIGKKCLSTNKLFKTY